MAGLTREQIEDRLFQEMQNAARRFHAKECPAEEYRTALQRFNDFILRGEIPGDLTTEHKPVLSEHPTQHLKEKKA